MRRLTEEALTQWGIDLGQDGMLAVAGVGATELANRFGTPLHVVNYERLQSYARSFVQEFRSRYPGKVEVYFAAKCNSVCGVLQAVRSVGLGVEVFTPYELRLASMAGYTGADMIVNGPAKSRNFLAECVEAGVRLVVADSLYEVQRLAKIASDRETYIDVLLRANVDYIPEGMNPGTATGSRKCVFGMPPSELTQAAKTCRAHSRVRLRGLHMHIGSGVRRAADYRNACGRLCRLALQLYDDVGVAPDYLDIGGGFGTPMVREFSPLEFVLYHSLSRRPLAARPDNASSFGAFAEAATDPIVRAFRSRALPLPILVLEPGRCLAGPNQLLLLRVLEVKQKAGRRDYVLTDGGQMPVNFPTFYEYHAIFSCRQPFSGPTRPVDIVGSGCYSADFVCRNALLPPVEEGDVLAVMDAGAYFLSFEGNFGFPRSTVIAVRNGTSVILRRAERYDDMLAREHAMIAVAR